MLIIPTALNEVGQAIQLALAPVFLLTGIAGLLGVMTGRLSRIIDRSRQIAQWDAKIITQAHVVNELMSLERRRYFASAAITSTTFSALLVCVVVTILFIEVLLKINLNLVVGLLFAASSLALVIGLAYFLREVHLATKTIRIPVTLG